MPSIVDDALARITGAVLRNRRLVRAPIWLYQHGLGRVLGSRLLLLEHTGRSSGLPRHVVLEVAGRPRADRLLVVSGFGETSQWLRNVRADPRVRVSTGPLDRVPARASELTRDDAQRAVAAYQRDHPRAWARLSWTIEQALGTDVDSLPVVALDLTRP